MNQGKTQDAALVHLCYSSISEEGVGREIQTLCQPGLLSSRLARAAEHVPVLKH